MTLKRIINELNQITNAIEELTESTNPLDEWCFFMLRNRKRALEKCRLELFQEREQTVSNTPSNDRR